jgi:hypothetical protein
VPRGCLRRGEVGWWWWVVALVCDVTVTWSGSPIRASRW